MQYLRTMPTSQHQQNLLGTLGLEDLFYFKAE